VKVLRTSYLIFAELSEEADNSEQCYPVLMTSATSILDFNEDLINLKLSKHDLLHVLIFLQERQIGMPCMTSFKK
jgi:hypothetical protein